VKPVGFVNMICSSIDLRAV